MDRIREPRRGGSGSSTLAVNGSRVGGPHHQPLPPPPVLPRRRPRTGGMRDSPEDDRGTDLAEPTTTTSSSGPMSRLRDRGMLRNDREREQRIDRSTRSSSKRRRGDRLSLHGGGRDDMDDTSDDSISDDDDDDDDEDDDEEEEEPTTSTRYQPQPLPTPSSSVPQNNNSSSQYQQQLHQNNNYHHNNNNNHLSPPAYLQQQKKGLYAKSPPVTWKAADEMIGVPVPRKARSASAKRSSHEWLVSGGGGVGGGGDPVHMQRQATPSASPSRPVSPASAASPSSSTASPAIRKKLKPINTGMKPPQPPAQQQQQQQPKISKSPSFIQEEIEVAEVLFGLTRQFQLPSKQQQQQAESKDTDSKQPAQLSFQPPDSSSSLPTAVAPKRKRPRIVKYDDDSRPASPAKMDSSETKLRTDALPEMQADPDRPLDTVPEPEHSTKDSWQSAGEKRQELANLAPKKEAAPVGPEANHGDGAARKIELASDGVRDGKYCIDLMVAPPDRDGAFDLDVDKKGLDSEMEMAPTSNSENKEVAEEPASRRLALQLDLEKPGFADDKEQAEQQQQAPKLEIKQERTPMSPQMPMAVGGWPGNIPPLSYFGQVPPFSTPAIHLMDVKPGSSNSFPPAAVLPPLPPRPKRCATHWYIAQQIQYNQRLSKMNPFLSSALAAAAAPGATLLLGPRPTPFNMGIVPSPDAASLLGTTMQGSHPGKNPASSLQANKGPSMAAALFTDNRAKEKASLGNDLAVAESNQQKPAIHQETPQSGPVPKMLGPAFIFPMNQQQAAAANRTGEAKPIPGAANAFLPSGSPVSSAASSGTSAMNLNFSGLPAAEAQLIAMMQNAPYQFPVTTHVAGAPQYRNAIPFFNGPVFPSQMLQPPQQQGPPQQHPQKSGMSSMTSSQKQQQQQMQSIFGCGVNAAAAAAVAMNPHSFPGSNQRPTLLPNLVRPQDGDKISQEIPSTTDNRAVLSHKGMYEHNYAWPVHLQNFALMQTGGAAHIQSDKKSTDQQQAARGQSMRVDLTSSQPFVMPFASFPVSGAIPAGLDFSSPAQNHALFQSHQEQSWHGYTQLSIAQAGQHKFTQHQITTDMKSAAGDSTTTSSTGDSERKKLAAAKQPAAESSHSLSFSKTDNKPFVSSILSSGMTEGSSRTLSLIPDSANGWGMSSKTTSAATPTVTSGAATASGIAAQPQQFIQIQKQNQQMQLQHQFMNSRPKSAAPSNNSSGYSERPPMPSNIANFPQGVMSFPQAVVQGGSVPGQSQLKASSTAKQAAPAAAPSTSNLIVMKNSNVHPQQGKTPLQALSVPSHQTQISFSINSSKPAPPVANLSGGAADLSRSSTATMTSGSPSNSVSKSTGGSPPASGNAKLGPPAVALQPLQQLSSKNSSSCSKSSSMNHHSIPSILGQPTRPLQYPHIYFSNAYTQQMQSHPATGAGYYQKRPSEKGQPLPHQQSTIPVSAGMLSLCPTSMSMSIAAAPSDPAKVMAAAAGTGGNMKVLQLPPGFLQATHLTAVAQPGNGASHPHMPTSFSFGPMVAQAMTVKPTADQKPAAGK